MEKKIIEIKDVSRIYTSGTVEMKAVDSANFSILEGEFVVVLGASGAGKTTMLNLLGGMDKANSGKVEIAGEDLQKYSNNELVRYRREKIGFVFQFYNLITNLTALENVEFASYYAKKPLDAKEILQKVGLEERLDNFPAQLSGGEQQRVAIARAIVKNPMLLLCDEPTGALDYETGREVLQLLDEINKAYKKTVIMITHNAELAKMADRVIKMKSGRIEEIYLNENKLDAEKIEW